MWLQFGCCSCSLLFFSTQLGRLVMVWAPTGRPASRGRLITSNLPTYCLAERASSHMQRRATLKRESLERRLMVPTVVLIWLIILVKSSSLRSSWLSCGPVNQLQWLRSYRVSVTERWSTTCCNCSCKVSCHMLALWFPGDCRREYSRIVALFRTISMAVSRVPLYSTSRCNERVLNMTSITSVRRLVWLFS